MDGTQPIGSGSGPSHKKRWVIVGVMAAILLIVGGFFLVRALIPPTIDAEKSSSSLGEKVTAKTVCSEDIIKEASIVIANTNQASLSDIADKITALGDYDRDPNCLYILLQFSVAAGDATASNNYLAKLEKVYNSAVGFSKAFTVPLVSMLTIRENVAFVTKNAKESAAQTESENKTTADGSEAADKFQRENQ